MVAADEGRGWYVIMESDAEDSQENGEDGGTVNSPPGAASGDVTRTSAVNATSSRGATVNWKIDEDHDQDFTRAKKIGGMRRASAAMATGLAGMQAPDDLTSTAHGLANKILLSPHSGMSSGDNNRRPSTLTELHNSRKPIKRIEKVSVFIHTVFLKVGEIDTVNETFTADVYIQARWREPLLDSKTDMNLKEIDWSTYWNPNLYVDNCSGQLKENIWYTVMFNANMQAYVFERRRVSGKFNEKLELNQFPFDTQDVQVRLVSERSVREVKLEDDSSELSTVNSQSFVDEQEWRLYSSVETRLETVIRIYQGDDFIRPSFTTMCYAARRFGYYAWNIIFVMFFISCMMFSTFAVDWVKRENRLQLAFIILLTTITFKFAASSSLPRISYLTYLDKYILFSMITMGTICVWHAVLPSIHSYFIVDGDFWALITLGSFFILAHVTFFIIVYLKAIRRRNSFVEKEKLHKAKIKERQREESVMIANNNNIDKGSEVHRRVHCVV